MRRTLRGTIEGEVWVCAARLVVMSYMGSKKYSYLADMFINVL